MSKQNMEYVTVVSNHYFHRKCSTCWLLLFVARMVVVLVMVLNHVPSVSHGWSMSGNRLGRHHLSQRRRRRRHDSHSQCSALHHHRHCPIIEKKIHPCHNAPTRMVEGEPLSGEIDSSLPYDQPPTEITTGTTIPGQQHQERYSLPSSRRDLFRAGAAGLLFLTTTTTTMGAFDNRNSVVAVAQEYKPNVVHKAPRVRSCMEEESLLVPINITKVASENNINVSLSSKNGCVSVDRKTFAKIITRDYPAWVPAIFRLPQQIKVIPNSELLVASLVAGATTEVVRTGLLYPLSTIKARIQATQTTPSWNNETKTQPSLSTITNNNETSQEHVLDSFLGQSEQGLETLFMTFYQQAKQGNLYAGIVPTLLVTIPAAGVYAGVRDVSKRMLAASMLWPNDNDVWVSLLAALVADVVALAVRTPADALALRLQVAPKNTSEDTAAGDWVADSLNRLGPIIWTDLPNLLLRIALTNYCMTLLMMNYETPQPISEFEVETIVLACICAAVTTPFDVVRTRILIDQQNMTRTTYTSTTTTTNNHNVVWATMKSIAREGGISKLYSGWAERTLYLGIARASLDPIRILSYMGIRDAVLLKWFD